MNEKINQILANMRRQEISRESVLPETHIYYPDFVQLDELLTKLESELDSQDKLNSIIFGKLTQLGNSEHINGIILIEIAKFYIRWLSLCSNWHVKFVGIQRAILLLKDRYQPSFINEDNIETLPNQLFSLQRELLVMQVGSCLRTTPNFLALAYISQLTLTNITSSLVDINIAYQETLLLQQQALSLLSKEISLYKTDFHKFILLLTAIDRLAYTLLNERVDNNLYLDCFYLGKYCEEQQLYGLAHQLYLNATQTHSLFDNQQSNQAIDRSAEIIRRIMDLKQATVVDHTLATIKDKLEGREVAHQRQTAALRRLMVANAEIFRQEGIFLPTINIPPDIACIAMSTTNESQTIDTFDRWSAMLNYLTIIFYNQEHIKHMYIRAMSCIEQERLKKSLDAFVNSYHNQTFFIPNIGEQALSKNLLEELMPNIGLYTKCGGTLTKLG